MSELCSISSEITKPIKKELDKLNDKPWKTKYCSTTSNGHVYTSTISPEVSLELYTNAANYMLSLQTDKSTSEILQAAALKYASSFAHNSSFPLGHDLSADMYKQQTDQQTSQPTEKKKLKRAQNELDENEDALKFEEGLSKADLSRAKKAKKGKKRRDSVQDAIEDNCMFLSWLEETYSIPGLIERFGIGSMRSRKVQKIEKNISTAKADGRYKMVAAELAQKFKSIPRTNLSTQSPYPAYSSSTAQSTSSLPQLSNGTLLPKLEPTPLPHLRLPAFSAEPLASALSARPIPKNDAPKTTAKPSITESPYQPLPALIPDLIGSLSFKDEPSDDS